MTTGNKVLDQAAQLPDRDRARIAEQLISSLEPGEPDCAVEAVWQEEAEKRLGQIDRGEGEYALRDGRTS